MEMSAPGAAAVAVARGVGADELDGLHEHAGRAAARVVDAAVVGSEHLDEQTDDGARGVELAALAALGQGELLQEVLVDAAEHVGGAGICPTELDVAHQVYHLSQASLVQRGAGVVLGQHVLQRRVVTLDGGHCVVDEPVLWWAVALGIWMLLPTRLGRHPEDALGAVLVRVFGICTVRRSRPPALA